MGVELWRPFEEPLKAFIGKWGEPIFWERGVPDPPKDVIQIWLDKQLGAT